MNTPLLPEHGGPDGGLPITLDFSTNANPLGPPPGPYMGTETGTKGHRPALTY